MPTHLAGNLNHYRPATTYVRSLRMNNMSSTTPVREYVQMLPPKPHDANSPSVSGGRSTGAKHKKTSSQMESFLRCAKEAGVKIEEGDWEVISINEEGANIEEVDWVLVK